MTKRVKLIGFAALGLGALLLAACGGSGGEPASQTAGPAKEEALPSVDDVAKEAAIAADAPPEAPVENTEEPTAGTGEVPPPPPPTKSEEIFY